MKKLLLLAIVIVLSVSVNAFARDDNHLQDIKNWTPFLTKNGITYSYEHKEGFPNIAMTYKFKDAIIGHEYFYVKIEMPEVKRNEITEKMRKDSDKEIQRKFKNVKLGYIINWCEMDCRNEMIELIETYDYSDTNELILCSLIKGKPVKMAGSNFEKIPFDRDGIQKTKQEAELRDRNKALRQKYGIEKEVGINLLEANPYEFEGHTIAVVVQFRKMLSKNSASFYSGYTDLESHTNVYDEIIVTGIPSGTHFKSGFFSPRMLLALKGKGTIKGTNAFGARIKAPHFQWIAIISGKQPSVFEEGRDVDRQNIEINQRAQKAQREGK